MCFLLKIFETVYRSYEYNLKPFSRICCRYTYPHEKDQNKVVELKFLFTTATFLKNKGMAPM